MAKQSARVFNDRYELVRRIARGGMAEVYLAHDLLLDRPVALKVLFPELAADRSFVERFRREAQAAANLSHPNIVSIYDWGEETGTYFIVMEYVDGRPLSQLIRGEGTLGAKRAADIGADVAAALAFAHRNGVIHRDVKPGNVLLDETGTVKVTDFGIARAVNAQDNLTQTGTVMGTATYFSPEQAQGYGVDNRSDVYSLGVVLYEMVTGQAPFTGENPVSVAYRHVSEPPVPPSEINPSVPRAFESIVLQAMAKDPDGRYATADDLRSDLLRFRRGRAVVARPPEEPTTIADATAVQPRATRTSAVTQVQGAVPAAARPDTNVRTYVGLLIGLLAVLGVLLYLLARSLGVFGEGSTANVPVPNLIGQPEADAVRAVEQLGLEPNVVRDFNRDQPEGRVFNQDPAPDARQTEGGEVRLFVSRGTRQIDVPDVVGQEVSAAKQQLEAAGLTVRTLTRESDEPANRVLDQSPDAGTRVEEGTQVTLTASAGRTRVEIPDVSGQDENDAIGRLQDAGFRVRRATAASDSVDAGKVIRTDPPAGTEAAKGSTVTVVVSTGPEQVVVPNVVGDTQSVATNKLQNAGLRVDVVIENTSDPTEDGRVTAQSPAAGSTVAPGTAVTITVGNFSPGSGGND